MSAQCHRREGGNDGDLDEHKDSIPLRTREDGPAGNAHSTTVVPNGGLIAYLQVAGAFCLFFNSWYAETILTDQSVELWTDTRTQGGNQRVRRLPDILPVQSSQKEFRIRNLMDRLHRWISASFHERGGRAVIRRRLFPKSRLHRHVSFRVWNDDDEHLHQLLAGGFGSGGSRWHWRQHLVSS